MTVIRIHDVWEMYRIKFVMAGKPVWENYWALRGLSFDVQKGEKLGIIGENGAGKSTVLKLIAGLLKPDRGEISVQGKVSGLLELGAGFEPELTGEENIRLNAGLFGISEKNTERLYEKVVDFTSLGKFIHAPIRCYSQGMFVRLAFSLAIHADPDILVIDDTLAVGDEHFQKKCFKKIFELKEKGCTLVMVSHDIPILKKLCERVLLLREGKLVQDGTFEQVVPLYAQLTHDNREGVGELVEGPLRAVFNNGKLFINWQDRVLTPHTGISVNFLAGDKWRHSPEAEWHVSLKGNSLVATGNFFCFEIRQIWNVTLNDDRSIQLEISFEGDDSLEIQERCISVIVSEEYQRWRTLISDGVFPSIDKNQTMWQNLIDDDVPPQRVGLEGQSDAPTAVPALILEQERPSSASRLKLLNTDHGLSSRGIEYREKNISEPVGERSSLAFSGKIMVGCLNLQEYFQRMENSNVLFKDKYRLVFDKGRYHVFFGGRRLTKAGGLSASFYAQNKWHSSESIFWECAAKENHQLVARGVWPELGLTQLWTLKLHEDNSFSWTVEIEADHDIEIPEQHLNMSFSEQYDRYQSAYGRGFFPDRFLGIEVDALQRTIPGGRVYFLSPHDAMPAFSFEISSKHTTFMKIFNSDLSTKARILRVGRVEPEDQMKFVKGKHLLFEVSGKLEEASEADMKAPEKTFASKNMKFSCSEGVGRIFWDGKELTKKLGLYTSLLFQGRWHNSSSHALWTMRDNNDGFCFVGTWLRLPLVQTWKFDFQEPDSIHWRIDLRVEKDVEVTQLQSNIMFSEHYDQWVSQASKGNFPPFREDIDDEWQIVWSNRSAPSPQNEIKIIHQKHGSEFPAVQLSCLGDSAFKRSLNVVNSDLYHRGRLLQYRIESENGFLMAGAYCLCDAKICLMPA